MRHALLESLWMLALIWSVVFVVCGSMSLGTYLLFMAFFLYTLNRDVPKT